MSWLHNQKLKWHRRFLQKTLQEVTSRRYSLPYDRIRTIGIFFDATDLDEREVVLRHAKALKTDGKIVRLLGYFDNHIENPNYTFPHFNKKDLDWRLRPKKKAVGEFLQEPFDLLILAFPESHFLAEYLGALSAARMRVGPVSEQVQSYDIMIDSAEVNTVQSLLDQVDQLLKKTIKTHEAAGI